MSDDSTKPYLDRFDVVHWLRLATLPPPSEDPDQKGSGYWVADGWGFSGRYFLSEDKDLCKVLTAAADEIETLRSEVATLKGV
jgi:hypothetical protein